MAISDLPYLHALGDGGRRPRTQVVVIHATDNTASAEAEASYATHRPDRTSAHLYIDADSAVRALPLENLAYGCLFHGNQISIQVELCGRSNQISEQTLRQAAPVVAELCRRYGLPVVKLTASQVAAGAKGICGHADITNAFPSDRGTHTDPGLSFPWPLFLDLIRANLLPAPEGTDMLEGYDPHYTDGAIRPEGLALKEVWTGLAWGKTAGGAKMITGRIADDVAAVKTKVDTLAGVDLDALAAKVADRLPAPPTAAEVASELIKQLRGG